MAPNDWNIAESSLSFQRIVWQHSGQATLASAAARKGCSVASSWQCSTMLFSFAESQKLVLSCLCVATVSLHGLQLQDASSSAQACVVLHCMAPSCMLCKRQLKVVMYEQVTSSCSPCTHCLSQHTLTGKQKSVSNVYRNTISCGLTIHSASLVSYVNESHLYMMSNFAVQI